MTTEVSSLAMRIAKKIDDMDKHYLTAIRLGDMAKLIDKELKRDREASNSNASDATILISQLREDVKHWHEIAMKYAPDELLFEDED